MPSIAPKRVDKLQRRVVIPRGSFPKGDGGYRRVTEELLDDKMEALKETNSDLRERVRETSSMLNVAKAQIELAQSESKRMNMLLDRQIKQNDQLRSEIKRISGNGNGIPTALEHKPEEPDDPTKGE
jgi:hypothetical protein